MLDVVEALAETDPVNKNSPNQFNPSTEDDTFILLVAVVLALEYIYAENA